MRAVLQKVLEASVTVDGKVVGQIGKGVCVLVGINQSDTKEDLEHVAKKILGLRVFEDESGGMWKKSVKDLGLEVLCVSQFTLYGKTTKGTKPDFHEAMKSSESKRVFDDFVQRLGELYDSSKISTGQFGAMMKLGIVNDGPVTLSIDSRKFTYQQEPESTAKAAKEQRRRDYEQAQE